jgi:hypothetical protein
MAPRQENRNIQKVGRQPSPSVSKDQGKPYVPVIAYLDSLLIGKRPQGIKKDQTLLSSSTRAHPEEIQLHQGELQPGQEQTVCKDRKTESKHSLPFLTSIALGKDVCGSPPAMLQN